MYKYILIFSCMIFILISIYSLFLNDNSSAIDDAKITADYIIRETERNYSSLKTYSDTGYIESELVNVYFYENEDDNVGEETKSLTKTTFGTSFIRDVEMVFNYFDEEDVLSYEIIAGFEKRLIFTRIYAVLLEIDGTFQEKNTSLHSVLSSYKGVSSGVSTLVPMLLLFNNESPNINTKHELERLDDAVLEGSDYYRVKIQHNVSHIDPGVEIYYSVYWICKESFLIHLVEKNIKYDDTVHKGIYQHISSNMNTQLFDRLEISFVNVASNTKIRYYPKINVDLTANITEPLSLQKQIKGEIYIPGCLKCAQILNFIELMWIHDKIMFTGFACTLLLGFTFVYVMVRSMIRRFGLNCLFLSFCNSLVGRFK